MKAFYQNKRCFIGCAVIIVAATLGFDTQVQAWSSRWDPDVTGQPGVPDDFLAEKAHNWIVYHAMRALDERGKLPFPMTAVADPDDPSGFNPFHLISYGLWFADHAWGGPPEDHEAAVVNYADLELLDVWFDDERNNDGDAWFNYYRTETKYKKYYPEWKEEDFRPNLYLEARTYADLTVLDDVDERYGADNY